MEVIEISEKRRQQIRPTTCPVFGKKCTRRYVQPARVESYAPERTYCPPTKPLDASTTYHLSYLNAAEQGQRDGRAVAFRPRQSLEMAGGKFEDGTTNRLSYQPVWGVVKAKPIIPRRRATLEARGSMECTTTARQSYSAKISGDRARVILPCGNIRTSSGILDASTTAGLSYVNPGCVRRPESFKPAARYCPPTEPTSNDTTQKLSYQPFRVAKRETYPWAMKPLYKAPVSAMDAHTTYSKSYYADDVVPTREKPFVPRGTMTVPMSDKNFVGKTVYSESFLPCERTGVVIPVVPSNNIALSNDRMTCDTTNKLSYQPVRMEKREPIRPSIRRMLGDGPMQSETTNRRDFVPNTSVPRPDAIVPCDNIRTCEDAPLEGHTTAALSYLDPGPILPVESFKPRTNYSRPTSKIETDTVNKLSYQCWAPAPRPTLQLPRKDEYQLPKDPMATNTIYHMSFPAPGYYIEDDCDLLAIDSPSRHTTPCTDFPKTRTPRDPQ